MSLPDFGDCILDHIAVAVKKLDTAKSVYQDLGLIFANEVEEVAEQKVLTAFAQIDQNAHLELLEPTSDESAIAKFIATHGEGIHHICFKVSDIKLKMQELQAKGYRFIYPDARLGAGGCWVNFIHPKSACGVLIELSQRPIS